MSDANRELVELKREVHEARNQAIKTDNQVKNMALDIKGFEKRFDALERRIRLTGVGVHGIVAATIAIAAIAVGSIREGGYRSTIAEMEKEAKALHSKVEAREAKVTDRLAALENAKRSREASQKAAIQLLGLIGKDDERAVELLPDVKLSDLTELEQSLVGKKFADLREKTAESAYKSGRSHFVAGRHEPAAAAMEQVVKYSQDKGLVSKSRYWAALSHYELRKFDAAESHLRPLMNTADKVMAEEVRYLLGTALAKLDKRDEARKILEPMANVGRYQASVRKYLAALEAGTPVPGSVRAGD